MIPVPVTLLRREGRDIAWVFTAEGQLPVIISDGAETFVRVSGQTAPLYALVYISPCYTVSEVKAILPNLKVE